MTYNEILSKPVSSFAFKRVLPSKEKTICIDAGSTCVRSSSLTSDDVKNDNVNFNDALIIPTPAIQVRRRFVLRPARALDENFEVKIQSNGADWHFLKGKICKQCSQESKGLEVTVGKADQELLYQSVLFQTAIQLLVDDFKEGCGAEIYDVDIVMSIPPEDILNGKSNQVVDRLLGTHTVELPRIRKTLQIRVNDVCINSEPECVANAYLYSDPTSDNINFIVIDCGGRNMGLSMMKKGNIITDATVTAYSGGKQLSSNKNKIH